MRCLLHVRSGGVPVGLPLPSLGFADRQMNAVRNLRNCRGSMMPWRAEFCLPYAVDATTVALHCRDITRNSNSWNVPRYRATIPLPVRVHPSNIGVPFACNGRTSTQHLVRHCRARWRFGVFRGVRACLKLDIRISKTMHRTIVTERGTGFGCFVLFPSSLVCSLVGLGIGN